MVHQTILEPELIIRNSCGYRLHGYSKKVIAPSHPTLSPLRLCRDCHCEGVERPKQSHKAAEKKEIAALPFPL